MLSGTTSAWVFLLAGVPIGSILGPVLFFLLNINDFVNAIEQNICLYAYDTSLFIAVDNPLAAAICLNTDLSMLTRWAATWLVTFNPTKNESLQILCKIIKPYHPSLNDN